MKKLDLHNDKLRYFLKCRADDAVEGEQEALSRLCGAEIHTGLLLEEQRNQILLAAQGDIIMQGSGAERADDAIRELNRQIRDHRMKSTIEFGNMKVGEENELGSMQNYKTVRRLNDMIVVRLATLARTSSLHLLCRRWMRDQSMGMLASPLVTQEREKCDPIQN